MSKLIVPGKKYTDSAMSDLIKRFFITFKENNEYKYTNLIDIKIIETNVIEIDFNDFNDEIQSMLKNQTKERNHTAIYRAISEIFQIRYSSIGLDNVKNQDDIKFKLINSNIFESKICSNPKLIHYENYDEAD